MLPVARIGIDQLTLPTLPPSPSGPTPSGPGFKGIYDQLLTSVPQPRPGGLPTAMEVMPLIAPASDMSQPFKASPEFPNAAIDGDGLRVAQGQKVGAGTATDAGSALGSFLQPLKEGLGQANELAHDADRLANEAAIGGDVDLHDVMIANEKASVATQLVLQVRNQIVSAYQDVMRMQV